MRLLLSFLLISFCTIKLLAFEIGVSGIAYFNRSYYVAANEQLIFYVNGKLQSDSVTTGFNGVFHAKVNINFDTLNVLEIFAYDCERQGVVDPIASLVVKDSGDIEGLKVKICSDKFDPCEVYFQADSVDEHTIQFVDSIVGNIVSWQWYFGDGTGSDEMSPKHFYYAPGTYEVALLAKTADSTECMAIDTVFVAKSRNLYGKVFLNSTMLDSGMVRSYYINHEFDWGEAVNADNDTVVLVDNGGFKISRKEIVTSYVQIIPQLDINQEHLPVYFPTYYTGSFYWDECKQFYSESKDSLHVNLLKRDYFFYGNGSISGKITIPEGEHVGRDKIIVFLLDDAAQYPLKYTYLNSDSTFVFNNVEMGNFNLFVDVFRVESEPMPITLQKEKPNKNIEFVLGDFNYTSVNLLSENKLNINVYPNPFVSKISLDFSSCKENTFPMQIINSSGSVVYSQLLNSKNGLVNFNLGFLPTGLYVVQTPEASVIIQKVH